MSLPDQRPSISFSVIEHSPKSALHPTTYVLIPSEILRHTRRRPQINRPEAEPLVGVRVRGQRQLRIGDALFTSPDFPFYELKMQLKQSLPFLAHKETYTQSKKWPANRRAEVAFLKTAAEILGQRREAASRQALLDAADSLLPKDRPKRLDHQKGLPQPIAA